MTSERAQAYGRVIRTLEELSASKLHPGEEEAVREAADALVFTAGPEPDAEAREALAEVRRLVDEMVSAERLLLETAEQLLADVEGCGPVRVPVAS